MAVDEKLPYFPINLFGAILGFSGLTLAFFNASSIVGITPWIGQGLALLTTALFFVITAVYVVKWIKFRQAVVNEFNHPVAMNFFSAISISLILLSLIYRPILWDLAAILFYVGAVSQFLLTLHTLQTWLLQEKWQIVQMTPAWFIPIVGNIVAPLGAMEFASPEVAWFFFSIGLVFWITLQAIVMYRLFFHPPMMKMLEPTLFILIAPPSMGFLSYVAMHPLALLDEFARILYYIGLFFAILLFTQAGRFLRVPFSVSWWAYTFPISAIANASFIMYERLHSQLFGFFAAFFLSVLSALILHLTIKTILMIKNGELCTAPTPQDNM